MIPRTDRLAKRLALLVAEAVMATALAACDRDRPPLKQSAEPSPNTTATTRDDHGWTSCRRDGNCKSFLNWCNGVFPRSEPKYAWSALKGQSCDELGTQIAEVEAANAASIEHAGLASILREFQSDAENIALRFAAWTERTAPANQHYFSNDVGGVERHDRTQVPNGCAAGNRLWDEIELYSALQNAACSAHLESRPQEVRVYFRTLAACESIPEQEAMSQFWESANRTLSDQKAGAISHANSSCSGYVELRLTGNDADTLLDAIKPMLNANPPMSVMRVEKQYGPKGARTITVGFERGP